jgi:hypothetical protein
VQMNAQLSPELFFEGRPVVLTGSNRSLAPRNFCAMADKMLAELFQIFECGAPWVVVVALRKKTTTTPV